MASNQNSQDVNIQNLLHAAHFGRISEIKTLLEQRVVDINSRSAELKATALHIACRNSNIELIKFLISNGADVNLKDTKGKHSLHLAVSSGSLKITRYLIDNGASIEMIDGYGRSPLHWAALNSHKNIVKELLERGSRVWYSELGNWQPIHESVKAGNSEITKLLIDKGSPVNIPETNVSKVKPFSPLHIAAREGKTDCVKLLLKNDAVVNYLNEGRQSPLHEAAHSGAKDVVQTLVLHGADPNIENNLHRTALHEACHQGHNDCVVLLLDAGCNISHEDHRSETALMLSLRRAMENQLQELTPLIVLCDIMLQYGANPHIKDCRDHTALSLANQLANRQLELILQNAIENPQPLMQQCKICIRRQIGCNYNKISSLEIPIQLQNYLLTNCTFHSNLDFSEQVI